ncbi:MAG: histidine--tRNA ligase [Oscillospiraceae bacterium]|nr:histidine--tRNA ligase [Oscillospiraceae bacterium]
MSLTAPKGTRDLLPPQTGIWRQVEACFAETCALFQYGEIRIPTFEYTEVFQHGVGDTTDIVQKEMYTFEDKGGRSLTLRPEGTAGVVRSFIEQGLSSRPYPVKLFYILNLFRYENVQKGRYREFHQLGLEAFGARGPEIDAEVIALLSLFFERLGLRHICLHLNSLGTAESRQQYNEALRRYYQPHLQELCPDCQRRFAQNPLRLLDCKVAHDHDLAQAAPLLFDYLDPESREHFDGVTRLLQLWDIPYELDKRIVRGLDYYSRTVFEFVSENVGTQGTICGGGRYDSLVETLGGPAVPACGFAIGEERLLMEMEAQAVLPLPPQQAGVFLATADQAAVLPAARLAQALRRRGLSAAVDLCQRSLKAQMKYANRLGLPFSIVIGADELACGEAKLRSMAEHREQPVSLADPEQMAALLKAAATKTE